MGTTAFPPPLGVQIERLIVGLGGVVSARAVVDTSGSVEEIHVLATGQLHPKQIVRNIESALSAGLGLDVDRRVISVAQMRSDTPIEAPAEDEDEWSAEPGASERVVFTGLDTRTDASGQMVCTVVVRRGESEFAGAGAGPNTTHGRASSAARALFQALEHARGSDDVALEGVALLDAHGRMYVLVGARGLVGRNTIVLTGVAQVSRSPEEAAVLASLQATNRWTEVPA